MTTDPQHMSQAETADQNSGASAAPPETKSGEKKAASTHSVPKPKSSSTGTAQAVLGEERRKAAEAQAAMKDMQRRLDAIEATLADERRKADEAQQALEGCLADEPEWRGLLRVQEIELPCASLSPN